MHCGIESDAVMHCGIDSSRRICVSADLYRNDEHNILVCGPQLNAYELGINQSRNTLICTDVGLDDHKN